MRNAGGRELVLTLDGGREARVGAHRPQPPGPVDRVAGEADGPLVAAAVVGRERAVAAAVLDGAAGLVEPLGPVLVQLSPEHEVCVSTFCPLSVLVWGGAPSMFVV